jgi:hypothetical protein
MYQGEKNFHVRQNLDFYFLSDKNTFYTGRVLYQTNSLIKWRILPSTALEMYPNLGFPRGYLGDTAETLVVYSVPKF